MVRGSFGFGVSGFRVFGSRFSMLQPLESSKPNTYLLKPYCTIDRVFWMRFDVIEMHGPWLRVLGQVFNHEGYLSEEPLQDP